jgi:hypothetical protein
MYNNSRPSTGPDEEQSRLGITSDCVQYNTSSNIGCHGNHSNHDRVHQQFISIDISIDMFYGCDPERNNDGVQYSMSL